MFATGLSRGGFFAHRLAAELSHRIAAIAAVGAPVPKPMIDEQVARSDVHAIGVMLIHGPFDAVVCVSTLEHIVEHRAAMRHMLRLTRPGGHLIVTAPYHETRYHPNVDAEPEAAYGRDLPYPAQSFSRAELDTWLAGEYRATLVDQEYWKCFAGELWTFGELLRPPQRAAGPEDPHQLTCVTLQRR